MRFTDALRQRVSRPPRRISRNDPPPRSFLAPVMLGAALWIASPTVVALQDAASMVSGAEQGGERWGAFLEKSPAGSIHKASMSFVDGDMHTGSIVAAGSNVAGIGEVAITAKQEAATTPDELRVNRAEKRGRIVKIAPVAPPKAFSAGSIFERTSSLLRPSMDSGVKMAFAKPVTLTAGIRVAEAFHRTSKPVIEPDPLPVYLAAIATKPVDDKAIAGGSVIDGGSTYAAAYAATGTKFSPFSALLNPPEEEKKPDLGFIPPRLKGDHAWIQRPLPKSVFSKTEQDCLATGIYFEARGESAKGQAAVGQVILNRVRNPAFPSTICGVVYQNKSWRNRCQFSFACDGIRDRVSDRRHWQMAKEVAEAVTSGKVYLPEVASATHYHATYVRPRWARRMERMQKIGLHIFYRTNGGGWS